VHIKASPAQSIRAIAQIFGIKYSTAYAMVRRFEDTGSTDSMKRGGARNLKMTPAARNAVLDWVDNQPDLTLQTIATRLQQEHNITISLKTVATVLNKAGFTFKLTRAIPASRNCPETISARHAYAQNFRQHSPLDSQNIIWVDETGFNLHLRRRHGRALSGLRANLTVPNNRGRNISICGAMSKEGFISHQIRFGSYNANAFCEYLQVLFGRLCELGRHGCRIIVDNVRFHHSACVLDCVQQAGHFIHFLPPYSPMLNPIESLFGKWKTAIRTDGVSVSQEVLLTKIETAKEGISVRDCLSWIRDVERNMILCLHDHAFDD
jgi:transposase